MGIGASIFLLALGAILAWAVEFETSGFDINTIGVILMLVGLIGLIVSFLFWNSPGVGFGGRRVVRDDYVEGDVEVAPRRRRVRRVVEDDVL